MKQFFQNAKKHFNFASLCTAIAFVYIAHISAASDSLPAPYQALHQDGHLTQPVQEICTCLGASDITTLAGFNTFAQANLLRRADSRLRKQEHHLLPQMLTHRERLIKQFATLGLIGRIHPDKKEYEHALVLSDHKFAIHKRFDHLKELVEEGYTFKKIVLMAAELKIEPEEEIDLPEGLHTQTDMMLHEYLKYSCFKGMPIMIVSPPMETRPDGSITRPNTDSQYRDFLKKDPTPGPCLVISHNPHTRRQVDVGKRLMNQALFPTSCAGPAATNPEEEIVMLHDELARLTYENFLAFCKSKTTEATKA